MDCQLRFGGHLYWRASRLLCIQYLSRRSRRKCVWYCDSGAEALLCSYPFSFLQGRFYFLAKLCDLMKLTKIFKRGIINLLACRVFVLFKISPVFFILGQMSDSVLLHTLLSCVCQLLPKATILSIWSLNFSANLVLTFFSHCLYKNTYETTL